MFTPDSGLNKMALRRTMRETRRALSVETRQQKSQAICAQALALPHYATATHISAYYPTRSEVDCKPILKHALQQSKSVYLPVVRNDLNKILLFSVYTGDAQGQLSKNALGVLEPPFNPETALTAKALRLVFVPMLAFDQKGYRLGTGGGYYDCSFDWLQEARLKKQANCILVGLAFDCQEATQLPVDPWDITMDYIVTESRTIDLTAQSGST
ncbi:MAG: hypothetical protein RLZ35_774 [Pseudomonadota bacterium]|jgi:5-formyltetrahydrofolate cyclo-ligase